MLCTVNAWEGMKELIDVTGDGVDDEVIVGKSSVVIVDGATGERIIYKESEIDTSFIIMVRNTPAIEVITSWYGAQRGGRIVEVLLYKREVGTYGVKGKLVEIYRGEDMIFETNIELPELGKIYFSDIFNIPYYYNGDKLVPMKDKYKKEDELTIPSRGTKKITFVVLDKEVLFLNVGCTSGEGFVSTFYEVYVSIYDSKGNYFFKGYLSPGDDIKSRVGSPIVVLGGEKNGEPLLVYLQFTNEAVLATVDVYYSGSVFLIESKKNENRRQK